MPEADGQLAPAAVRAPGPAPWEFLGRRQMLELAAPGIAIGVLCGFITGGALAKGQHGERLLTARQLGHRPERRHLRHAPGVRHVQPVASLEALKATKRRAVIAVEPVPNAPPEDGIRAETRASPIPSSGPPAAPLPQESQSAPSAAPAPDMRAAEDALASRLLDARRRRRSNSDE